MMKMAEVARREGVLALEEKLKDIEDPFLQQGLQLVVDGMDTVDAVVAGDTFRLEIETTD